MSRLKDQVSDSKDALLAAEGSRNTLKAQFEEAQKKLEEKEKECRRCGCGWRRGRRVGR